MKRFVVKKKKKTSFEINRSIENCPCFNIADLSKKKKKKNGLNNGMNKLLHLSSSIDRRGNKLRGKKN